MKRIFYVIPVIFALLAITFSGAKGEDDLGEICYNCHEEPGEHNVHYPGRKPTFPIPDKFKLSPDGALQCATCHLKPDQRQQDELFDEGMHEHTRWLVVDDGPDAAICGECHVGPRDWDGSKTDRHGHPVYDVAVDEERAAKLMNAGDRLGDEGRLGEDGMVICRTCHAAHGGKTPRMNVLTTRDSKLCLACHPDRDTYINGKFTNHPLGVRARRVEESFEKEAAFGPNRTIACITCHQPHGAEDDWAFLRRSKDGGRLCLSCHADKRYVTNGPHGRGKACFNCHSVHDSPSSRRLFKWASEGKGKVNREMTVCVQCHKWGGAAAPKVISYYNSHPMDIRVRDPKARFNGWIISCTVCHNVHRGPGRDGGSVSYIRIAGQDGGVCVNCHYDKQEIIDTPHAVADGETMCRQCHTAHRPKIKDDLWKRPLPDVPDALPQQKECFSCHGEGGLASGLIPKYWIHPYEVEAMEAGDARFYTSEGRRAKEGEDANIVCQTCHNPHSARKFFLRPSEPIIEFCSMCHDEEAPRRYRKFHFIEGRPSKQ